MRETWEKQKSDFIEVNEIDWYGGSIQGKVLIRKKEICAVKKENHKEKTLVIMTDREYIYVSESYEEIKEMLGV